MNIEKRNYLNSLHLKLIAACAMLIDHTMYTFYPYAFELRTIGRLAFPIFAFLVAVGYDKTKSLTLYLGRMFLFAFIAQVPYEKMIGLGGVDPNVIFTLAFGLLAVLALEKGSFIMRMAAPPALIILAETMGFDHGAYGVLMVIALYYARNSRILTSLWITVLTLLFSLYYILLGGFASPGWYIVLFYIGTIPFILSFNGEKGLSNRFTKWFFYVFYPLHIVILVVLRNIL